MKATVLPTNPPLISSNNEVWPFYVSAHNMSINNSEEDLKKLMKIGINRLHVHLEMSFQAIRIVI